MEVERIHEKFTPKIWAGISRLGRWLTRRPRLQTEQDREICFDLCTATARFPLTLYLLKWRIWRAPNNASKEQMGFNSAFKGLTNECNNVTLVYCILLHYNNILSFFRCFLLCFFHSVFPLSLSSHFLSPSSSHVLFSSPLNFSVFNYVTHNLSFVNLLFPISLFSYRLHQFWLPSLLPLCLYFLHLT